MTQALTFAATEQGTTMMRESDLRRRLIPAFVLSLLIPLAGCSLGQRAAPAALFDLGPDPGTRDVAQQAPGANPLNANPGARPLARREAIELAFTAAPLLNGTGVIWRIGDSAAPHAYATYRWAAPPLQLVQQRLQDRLTQEGPVLTNGVDAHAPLVQVALLQFEQVYAADGASSQGRVALQVNLVRERRAVDTVRLARSVPAPTQDAEGGVAALREATDAVAGDLAAWLATRLPRPVPDTLPPRAASESMLKAAAPR